MANRFASHRDDDLNDIALGRTDDFYVFPTRHVAHERRPEQFDNGLASVLYAIDHERCGRSERKRHAGNLHLVDRYADYYRLSNLAGSVVPGI